MIAGGAFHPVFQPIVDITNGRMVGFEALTRFDGDVSPDASSRTPRRSAWAPPGARHPRAGAGGRASGSRAPRGFTSTSHPSSRGPAPLPNRPHRHRYLVLEITEHAVIDDYAEVRSAAAALGPPVMLAVDDAGAGFASLHHVIELRPAFVKLDRSLIKGIDADPGRQALVVGMLHFARQVGCRLIAEGVETPAELEALRATGIRLVQGYLLGRPARVG